MKKITQNDWIERCNEIHHHKYDYSNTKYISARNKVSVICHEKDENGIEHGVFEVRACNHAAGTGCPKCGKRYQMSRDEFLDKARKVHGNKYDYSKLIYTKSTEKVTIICPKHGEFTQVAASHLMGCGCPKCGTEQQSQKKRLTLDLFIKKARNVHGDKYDYSNVNYVDYKTKICIICPEHGEFWMTPGNHLNGEGCPKCKFEKLSKEQIMTTEAFIIKCNDIHGSAYDYSKVKYIGYQQPVEIVCPKHGIFWQTPDNHLHGSGCPKCGATLSKNEKEIIDLLKENNITVVEHDKKILKGLELDIYIPDRKIAIEYNGIYWHSECKGKEQNYHLNKLIKCTENNIKLIHIFEDEYIFHKDIVISKIKHLIGINQNVEKINGRDCRVKIINKDKARWFLNLNHIQGFTSSTVYLGAFFNNELVAVMSFKKQNSNNKEWELTRFATDIRKRIPGIGGKLFVFFTKNYTYSTIKSFADRRWTSTIDNNLYTKIGFKFDTIIRPDYKYVVGKERKHKFNFRKQILHKKYGLPLTMTENEMVKELGYTKIWDCGLIKYVYKNPNYKE